MMVEKWKGELEEKLGKKRCGICGEKLEIGGEFLLKDRNYYHPECYLEHKAEEIKEAPDEEMPGEVLDELTDRDSPIGGESN